MEQPDRGRTIKQQNYLQLADTPMQTSVLNAQFFVNHGRVVFLLCTFYFRLTMSLFTM